MPPCRMLFFLRTAPTSQWRYLPLASHGDKN
jgi:hypothetical protein